MTKTNIKILICEIIKTNIKNGKLKPGLILEVAPLSRHLSISRTPVAAALEELFIDGWLSKTIGRGYVVGLPSLGFRGDIEECDMWLPDDYMTTINNRGVQTMFYPKVEEEVAACLPFGKYGINVSRLAQHYGVSRANAHAALIHLERLGLVKHEGSRWYAGPMKKQDIFEHYEIRWTLEPIALQSTFNEIPKNIIESKIKKANACLSDPKKITIEILVNLEKDLHHDLISKCKNKKIYEIIKRSQIPVLSANYSFENYKSNFVRIQAIKEHVQVLDSLLRGDISTAMSQLEQHLKNSYYALAPYLDHIETKWIAPPYMTLAGW